MSDDALKITPAVMRALHGENQMNTLLSRKTEGQAISLQAQVTDLRAAKKDSPEEIEKAATQFEALLMQEMFQSMWTGVQKGGLFGGSGREEEFYRDMLNQALAEDVAERQSVGLKSLIAKDIAKIAEKGQK